MYRNFTMAKPLHSVTVYEADCLFGRVAHFASERDAVHAATLALTGHGHAELAAPNQWLCEDGTLVVVEVHFISRTFSR